MTLQFVGFLPEILSVKHKPCPMFESNVHRMFGMLDKDAALDMDLKRICPVTFKSLFELFNMYDNLSNSSRLYYPKEHFYNKFVE